MTPTPAARDCAERIADKGNECCHRSDGFREELEDFAAELIQQTITAESQKAAAERDALRALLKEAEEALESLGNDLEYAESEGECPGDVCGNLCDQARSLLPRIREATGGRWK